MGALSSIFKAYDIRGTYPDQLDEDVARRIGAAFARFVGGPSVVLGRDCRLSSPPLAAAFSEGVTATGTGVIDIGLATTDMLYFASGRLELPGAMFTASHNPPNYNGLKLCRAGAAPVGEDSGLYEVRDLAEASDVPSGPAAGRVERREILEDYVEHVLAFVEPNAMAPLTVVADAANGMAGLVLPAIFERLPVKLVGLFLELDGTFPNHPADPIQPENQEDLRRAVTEHGADLGLAFDGDADRVFIVDERARGVSGSTITALVAEAILAREPGARILHNLICSWAVPEVIREHGGEPIRTRVGHSLIKKVMAETGAAFGGEHSGHYYFRDHYRADSGIIAALVVMERLSRAGVPMSELVSPYQRYHASGEINSEVGDQAAAIERVAEAFADGRQDRLDGLTVEYEDWWFNVRPSNTEPLLRLNVEGRTPELLERGTGDVLGVIRGR
ncbi:MAG TPA: phosphomannomutase/phosphoglucomutase [Actinomycetota bacterium]|nr:phosphomannomutase/phosphoglucomutase [Actinomycetota bacterium]